MAVVAVRPALIIMLACGAVVAVRGDFAADRAECADKLMGLAPCLTYVQATATARSPTPDCCAGLKTVATASKKCMCVLVRDRDEPALGFQINVTRAMDLPDNCNFPATFSDCPKILNMTPRSSRSTGRSTSPRTAQQPPVPLPLKRVTPSGRAQAAAAWGGSPARSSLSSSSPSSPFSRENGVGGRETGERHAEHSRRIGEEIQGQRDEQTTSVQLLVFFPVAS